MALKQVYKHSHLDFHYQWTQVGDFPSMVMPRVIPSLSHHHLIYYLLLIIEQRRRIKLWMIWGKSWRMRKKFVYLSHLCCLNSNYLLYHFSTFWTLIIPNHHQCPTNFQHYVYLLNPWLIVHHFCHRYHRHDL